MFRAMIITDNGPSGDTMSHCRTVIVKFRIILTNALHFNTDFSPSRPSASNMRVLRVHLFSPDGQHVTDEITKVCNFFTDFPRRKALTALQRGRRCITTGLPLHDNKHAVATQRGPYGRTADKILNDESDFSVGLQRFYTIFRALRNVNFNNLFLTKSHPIVGSRPVATASVAHDQPS